MVGLDRVGGGVARLSVGYAGQGVGLQGLALRVVDVHNRCLLGVGIVGNNDIDVLGVVCHVLVGDDGLVRRVALDNLTFHVLEVLWTIPSRVGDFAGHLVDFLGSGEVQGVLNAVWRL